MPLGNLEYLCVHHVLLAHAKAYRLYQEKYKATQNGRYIFNVAFCVCKFNERGI